MKVTIPEDLEGKKLFDFLIANKSLLIAEKKYSVKHADAFSSSNITVTDSGVEITKTANVQGNDDTIEVSCIINTTKYLDSHRDLHIDGLWNKSLSENKSLYLLQEHSMTFKGIITDEVEASAKKLSWKTIGVDAPGYTEALLFKAKISKERNPFMFEQYKKGYVKNHSVGMRYVKMEMAINDEDYPEEFAVWNKYFDMIANKEEAENVSYFFAVTEAKAIEGSAVPVGSNRATPTLGTKAENTVELEPLISTQEQPLDKSFNIDQIIKNFQIN
jgi:hypothetical protein